MAEKNLTENLTPTADYISHHLTNLTYGWCEKSQTWGFAYHQQNIFKETSCKVSEMGFWSFHLATIFMSILLGAVVFGFFGLVNRAAKKGVPSKLQNFAEFVHESYRIGGVFFKARSTGFEALWKSFCRRNDFHLNRNYVRTVFNVLWTNALVFARAYYEFGVGSFPHTYNCFAGIYLYDADHCLH